MHACGHRRRLTQGSIAGGGTYKHCLYTLSKFDWPILAFSHLFINFIIDFQRLNVIRFRDNSQKNMHFRLFFFFIIV